MKAITYLILLSAIALLQLSVVLYAVFTEHRNRNKFQVEQNDNHSIFSIDSWNLYKHMNNRVNNRTYSLMIIIFQIFVPLLGMYFLNSSHVLQTGVMLFSIRSQVQSFSIYALVSRLCFHRNFSPYLGSSAQWVAFRQLVTIILLLI